MPKKILVTGATGFIGRNLVLVLTKNGYDVRILVRNEEKARKLFMNGVKYIIGDISDKKNIRKSLIDIDVVYHLAAIRGEDKLLNKEDYFRNNILPTKILCQLCLEKKIKLVYLSSSGVTGWSNKLPIDETFPYAGKGLYHSSKIESEKEILDASKKGLDSIIIRTVMVYGNGDDGFLFKLINLIKGRKFLIIGNGENRIHLLDVTNLVYGLLKTIELPKTGEIYYMADESPITINELTSIISAKFEVDVPSIKIPLLLAKTAAFFFDIPSSLFKIKFPISMASVDILTKDRYYSTEKAKKDFGFVGGDVRKYLGLIYDNGNEN